jgi:hypothetical protein
MARRFHQTLLFSMLLMMTSEMATPLRLTQIASIRPKSQQTFRCSSMKQSSRDTSDSIALYTFPVSQLITPARLALYMGDVLFTEHVIPSIDAWRNETALPLMVMNDQMRISRGMPILNYCAKVSGACLMTLRGFIVCMQS